ncbi:hypothetical protein KPL35_01480 [Clostridium sp. CF011]|uniref:hypothetical protein n=1 Tax=Clostridium sp. CF011 TaxID=2843318 RepID=UPI001C0CA8E8|nr:hypothetical protein [Clostridium sp. CF011]MBU3090762.1 hypothetical protein [Clostridium sp. CF011]WAG69538.1 hypothetical protein LL036_16335 [Clostridium sp. CF011]
MRQVNKKIGIGSISLLLYVMGILFASSFEDKVCYGDNILKFIGLIPWSNGNSGTHYTAFYSLLFFIPSVIVGYISVGIESIQVPVRLTGESIGIDLGIKDLAICSNKEESYKN